MSLVTNSNTARSKREESVKRGRRGASEGRTDGGQAKRVPRVKTKSLNHNILQWSQCLLHSSKVPTYLPTNGYRHDMRMYRCTWHNSPCPSFLVNNGLWPRSLCGSYRVAAAAAMTEKEEEGKKDRTICTYLGRQDTYLPGCPRMLKNARSST